MTHINHSSIINICNKKWTFLWCTKNVVLWLYELFCTVPNAGLMFTISSRDMKHRPQISIMVCCTDILVLDCDIWTKMKNQSNPLDVWWWIDRKRGFRESLLWEKIHKAILWIFMWWIFIVNCFNIIVNVVMVKCSSKQICNFK